MDCNKEEAARAKRVAELKLESKDFAGARKFALKAQQLYPDLDNISQLLSVCDVHCSAQNKMLGNERDWYGILQLSQTADDALIKKQYRKFALLLHPDKNKISGAEAAFMLIGEAQSVLLDKQKRALHDMKRRTFRPVIPTSAPQRAGGNTNTGRQVEVNLTGGAGTNVWGANSASQPHPPQAQGGVPNGRETFWTQCPFCGIRFQYYREVINRALRCQSCKKPFIAYDMYAQGVSQGTNAAEHPYTNQDAPGTTKSVARDGFHGQQTSTKETFAKVNLRQDAEVGSRKSSNSRRGAPAVDNAGGLGGEKRPKKVIGKRLRKKVEESSESLESGSADVDEGIEDEEIMSNCFKVGTESQPRRSSRSRRQVIYDEFVSDDDEVVNPSRRAKISCDEDFEASLMKENPSDPEKSSDRRGEREESLHGNDGVNDDVQDSSEPEQECTANSSPVVAPEPEILSVPDPDFHEFDDGRKEECFSVGQLWAVYDTIDAMPRFYARISKVFSPGFEVRISWLEPDPDHEHEMAWVQKDLPFSCGKFRLGTTDVTTERPMFSHVMSWDKGTGRNTFKIFPLKGETWALFKDWDTEWDNCPGSQRNYEYYFVEVLSEYDGTFGVRVAYLGKLKGFVSVFVRKSEDEVQVPPRELLRFSHRVPSFKLTGEEGQNVPRGSLELDPAAISMGLEEIPLPEELKFKTREILCDGSPCKSPGSNHLAKVVLGIASTCSEVKQSSNLDHGTNDNAANGSTLPSEFELSDSEFFNFDAMRSMDKFQVGQIWALYSDDDGLPKYYAIIKKVTPEARQKVTIQWLEPNVPSSDMDLSPNKTMPTSCGSFRVKIGKPVHLPDFALFSHQLQADRLGKKSTFTIYPRAGEVWALHKNRNPDVVRSDYDIVEVLEQDTSRLKVLFLEHVTGFNAVFKPCIDEQSINVLAIPGELFRFSHQVPCFRLTEEKGGSLRGFFELDSAALPLHMVRRN